MKKFSLTTLFLVILLTACAGTATPTSVTGPVATESAPDTVTAEGRLLPALAVGLSFAQSGVIADVMVKPGDQVAAGGVLARLVGIETVQAELAAAQLEQTTAQQALDAIKRNALLTASRTEQALLDAQKAYESESNGWNIGIRNDATDLELTLDDYISAEKDYRAARDKLNDLLNKDKTNHDRMDAQDDFDREEKKLAEAYADLLSATAENDSLLSDKQVKLLSAVGTLEVAHANLSRLDQNNLDPEILSAAEARLTAASAHVIAANAALELYELRAPFGGIILRDDLKIGETAIPGFPAVFLANTATWTVETKDLAEIDIARVALGQSVTIKLDAFPGEEFAGKVTAIDPVGSEYLGDMTFKVTIILDEADARFMWNMTATVSIDTA